MFAVAAYDKNGNLMGDSIGDSTEPILASSNLSVLMSYGYLCQVISFQILNITTIKFLIFTQLGR